MKAPGRIVLIAAWFALLTGLLDVLLLLRRLSHGQVLYVSQEFGWVVPAGDLLLFGAVAALLILLAFVLKPLERTGVVVGACAALAMITVLSYFRLHWIAVTLLALGVAIRAGTLVAAREPGILRFLRWSLVPLALLVGAGAVGNHVLVARRHAARMQEIGSGSAAAGAPNILLLVLDAVRARELSFSGATRPTSPRLATFAQKGAVFLRAFSSASYTLPGHASLFTGRWPHEMGIRWWVGLDRSVPTLAATLRSHGYRTGGFAANHIYVTWEYGLLRDFEYASDYDIRPMSVIGHAGIMRWLASFSGIRSRLGLYDRFLRRDAGNMDRSLLDWLGTGDRSKPFFAFVNYMDGHRPYWAPPPFDTLFGAHLSGAEARRLQNLTATDQPTPADVENIRTQYDQAIRHMDQSIGDLLDSLAARDLLRNTIVIVTADHGEAFMEHGVLEHGNDVHREEIEVPLVMVWPGRIPAGVRIDATASTRDLPATIGDLLGSAGSWPLPGRSLASRWSGAAGAAPYDTVFAETDSLPNGAPITTPVRHGDNVSILAWPFHLIEVGRRERQLFDLSSDSLERSNLADRPDLAPARDALLGALHRFRGDSVRGKQALP